LPEAQLEFVDETTSNWFNEIFGHWLDHRTITQTEYVTHLGKILMLAAHDSRTVIVGRGAQFVLPRDKGLLVRIVAPLKRRIERIMHERQCVFEEARELVERIDEERREFIRRYFHHDVSDPHLYDLVINLEHIPLSKATDLIVQQCRQRFPAEVTAGSPGEPSRRPST
jgi:cytidylate kinase